MNWSSEFAFIFFRIIIPTVVLGVQLLVYVRFTRWMRAHHPANRRTLLAGRIVFLMMNLAVLWSWYTRPRVAEFPEWALYAAVYPFFLWHGSTLFIGLFLLIGFIVTLPWKVAVWVARKIPPTRTRIEAVRANENFQRFDASRRQFLRASMAGVSASAFGISAYGMSFGRGRYEITQEEFTLENLHPDLDGFTIGLVSDIHSGAYMTLDQMKAYVRVIGSLGADAIVVVGDFINGAIDEVYPFAEAFSQLTAPYGVFGVSGNHEYYNGNPDHVLRTVDDCGVKLLSNDKTILEKGGGKFYLLGVDDVGRNNRAPVKLQEAIGHAPLDIPKVLLCHRPYYIREAASMKIDLVLSGHTHGGQVVFGKFGDVVIAPASLASRYVWGRYSEGTTSMYVSRGIGTIGLPMRVNCPPELTRIVLRSPHTV